MNKEAYTFTFDKQFCGQTRVRRKQESNVIVVEETFVPSEEKNDDSDCVSARADKLPFIRSMSPLLKFPLASNRNDGDILLPQQHLASSPFF